MKPLRMCMVCRQRKEKQELLRIVKHKDAGICVDPKGRMQGRGAYLCKDGDCIPNAQKRRALERAFSAKVEASVYESLMQTVKEESHES